MAFIYDDLIQRGVDYNTTTQDGYIPVNNLSVQLGDDVGATAVNVLNADQNAVISMHSDGYIGTSGIVSIDNHLNSDLPYINLNDTTNTAGIYLLSVYPNGVTPGTIGSIGLDHQDGYLYSNFGGTKWDRYVTTADLSDADSLQAVYNNSMPATIVTNPTNGSITINGTQGLVVNATQGIALTTGFNQTSSTDGFVVAVTNNPVSVDAYGANSHVSVTGADLVLSTNTSGNVAVNSAGVAYVTGQQGVVIDGYGNGLIPAVSNTDALGSATNGFSNLYVENVQGNAVVGLLAAGSTSAPNTTSGASAVGTNALNFASYGTTMTANTVQAALEAIDGYFVQLGAPNGDGYIGSNPANYTTFGPLMTSNTVAGALSAIDGYLQELGASTYTATHPLFLQAAVLNGNAVANNLSETPSIDLKPAKMSKMLWTMPVPGDWDGVSDFTIPVLWSPSNANTGTVAFELEYKLLNLTNLVTSAATVVSFTDTPSGTANALQSTAANLVIPGASVSAANAVIVINLVRNGAADTFTGNTQIHLVNYSYSAKAIG